MEAIQRACKYFYYRFIRLQASPEKLAWGMALGLFIGATPTFGIQMILAVVLAAIFRVSKLCALIGVQITNAFTAPFFYAGTYYLGSVILDKPFKKKFLEEFTPGGLWDLGADMFLSLWVGGVLVGAILAFIGFFVVIGIDTEAHRLHLLDKFQKKRLEKRNALNKEKNAPAFEKID